MMFRNLFGVGVLAAALVALGCDDKKAPPPKVAKPGEHAPGHDHEGEHKHGKGPHGGVVFDLGKHHGEFTVDHDKKTCTLYFLGMDEKTPAAVAAKDLTLTTKETKTKDGKPVAAMTIKLAPKDEKDGKATTFTGTDAGLGNVADFEGAVTGEIDGKPAKGEFKE